MERFFFGLFLVLLEVLRLATFLTALTTLRAVALRVDRLRVVGLRVARFFTTLFFLVVAIYIN
jgi:hypothetical protein